MRGPVKLSSRKSYESVGCLLLALIRSDAIVRSWRMCGSTVFRVQRWLRVLSGSGMVEP